MSKNNGENKVEMFVCPLYGVWLNCPMVKEIMREVVDVFGWMVEDNKWRFDEGKGNLDAGSNGGYSPKLVKAIELLESMK